MISHVFVGVTDFGRAMAFYRPLMEALGYPLRFVDESRPWAGWQPREGGRPLFLVGRAYEGDAAPGNGQMVALLAPNRAAVARAHDAALAAGGVSEGAPGLRPEYHPDYFGAYVRDPDGNKLCACCHDPEP
jgi:catechol 2,3-dioxygenase-like lactoylglutathione lyase family enzyme